MIKSTDILSLTFVALKIFVFIRMINCKSIESFAFFDSLKENKRDRLNLN